MPDPDIASAARRVADSLRGENRPQHEDLVALLPILDAVAVMPEPNKARVERWARAIFSEVWTRNPDAYGPAFDHDREAFEAAARAAIALADAERVAEGGSRVDV